MRTFTGPTSKPSVLTIQMLSALESHMNIAVFTLFDKKDSKISTTFYSGSCGLNEPSELWIGIESNKYLVIHPDEYYDDSLRARRNKLNMVSSWLPKERLKLIGVVWGGEPHLDGKMVVIGRSDIEAAGYGT